ncbi:uncharacterized protein PV09_00889 [Verruconis gallopava]|uniref:Uncharacterized protein n=1 Tax=Verruconis gallopava TaxID=253628 RepID=A0A0D1Y1R6_9PEZI|nr:uncharacterized protein PV09_00889 [Verruconis gallopava]KIW08986.1 hypothetical protein PV09_00889 [Verruconis gallopava]
MASIDASILSEITGTDSHIAPPTSPVQTTMVQTPIQASARRDSGFLVLAPVLSTDYPIPLSSATAPSTSAVEVPATEAEPMKKERRSSSVSSGDGLFKRKILRLGPIHGGDRSGSDFVELDEE